MERLRSIARDLLAGGEVQLVIGYGENDHVRAVFVRRPEDAGRLVFNDRCKQNLAVYLGKHEVKSIGKPLLVAHAATLRTVIQLAAEKQLEESGLVIMAVDAGGAPQVVRSFAAVEELLTAAGDPAPEHEDRELLQRIAAMPLAGRWAFWQEKLSRCFKCYACRAACPLCYCPRCTVEINQPQWISVPAHDRGNLEWHLMRAMHLAGRCTGCGDCGRACPLGIPVHLLSLKMNEDIFRQFAVRAGFKTKADHALSTFKPGDKEEFIR